MVAPIQISISVPGKPRASAYMANLVVKADRNTVPVTVASGYASCNQLWRRGKAALTPKATKISTAPMLLRSILVKSSEPVDLS